MGADRHSWVGQCSKQQPVTGAGSSSQAGQHAKLYTVLACDLQDAADARLLL